ncbi:MAG: ABC transporter substrate-binding protein [Bacteroidetes bacterium]|nr:ABC transporter substrate-binding protein [Bacteroidota bacterium]
MSFRRRFALFIFPIALFAFSCSPAENQSFQTSAVTEGMVDALGRKFPSDTPIQRVVTIAPGATEIVAAAGGLHLLVGVSNVDTFPDEVTQLPRFSVLPMDFEAIVALTPDIVFASSQVNDPQHVTVFESLGIEVFFLDGSSWDAVYNSIGIAGALLGTDSVAAVVQESLQMRVNNLVGLTEKVRKKPRAIFLISEVTSYSFGKGSYVQDLFEWAGIESLTAEIDIAAPLSDEWVLTEDPDLIFGTFGDDFDPLELVKHHPTWNDLKAIKSGAVFSIPQNFILRPGPRNVDAALIMAQKAHPELFSDLPEIP